MSDLVRYDPLEHGQLVGGLKKYRGFTQKDAWAAADDTALTRGFKNSMRSARMAWNDFTGDKEELGQLKAEDMDYRKIQEGRKSQARRELGEAWDKGEGVGGGLSNVWEELKKDWREKGLDGVLEDVGEMGGATLEQAPNALVPLATTTVGGILGTLAGGNTAVGAYAGATLGNTLMEYGEQLDRAAEAAGVDPTDKDAMMAFIDRGAPGALKNAAVKGAVVGAVDMATMKLGGSILNMGKKAAEKAALKKMGVAAADKAAVAAAKGTPEFAALAKESAKGGLGGAARHTAAYALDMAGEGAGEYLGTGLANGEWDEKGAALEAFSSLGHSAVEFVGTKAYAAMTDPLRLSAEQKADALADAKGNIEGNRKAGKLTPEEAQALRAAVEAALDGGVEQGGAGFDTAHHDQLYLTLQQFVDRTKQKEAEQFFSSPADSNTPHAEELAREMEKQPDVSGIPSEDEAEFLNTGVMSDGLARQYADMAAKYRAKPSEAMGINPDDGAISAAAALAVDSGAAVPSAVSDDVEAPSVADDVLSERSADADRGGVSSAYGNVRSGGAPRGAASVASGGSAAAASGGIARVAPLPAGEYFDGLDTRGRKALAKEAGFDIKGIADFGQIAAPVRQKIEQTYHARIEADYQAASEAKQGYLPPPVRMADAVPVPKKGFSVPADALNKESRRRFDALPEEVRRHAQTVADYTADGIMRQEAGMADMRGHYPAGLAESVRAVRAYRAEHPESADVLDRLNRAVYGYRRNNGWSVPLLSREGERLQEVRTALPDDGASEAVVGGGRGLPRALPTEDKGLAQDVRQDVRQGLTQGGRGLTPDAVADANAAALQGLPASAAVASGNAPTHRQNLQVLARAEGAAPGLPASENLAETDGGKRAPVAGKRPDTVLPVLNPEKAAGNIRRGRAAMNRALVEKADVRRAMYRNDIGWIDFVWGSTGRVLPNGKTKGAMGLAHVIESRMRKDGMSRDEVVGMLIGRVVDTIAKGGTGKIYRSGNSESMFVEYNGNRATLVKNKGSNGWLMNAFELHQNDDAGKSNDSSASTHKQATRHPLNVGASDTPNVRAKDESVNTADGTRFGRAAGKVSPKKRMADAAADFTRRLAADRRKLEKAGVPLGDGEYRFAHTNRKHIDALAGVLDRLGKGGMLEEFADMAGSSNSDGLVFDSRRYLKGKEAETLQAGGLLEAVPSKSGWDYRLTQEGRALAKVMARSRDAAASAGKSAGRAQSARAKDAPVAGKAAVAKNATTEKPSSDKAAKPETLVKTALDNPEEAQRKARVLQGEPVYTVKERQAPQGFKALREWAAALFEKAGGKAVNPEAGEILLNERSVRDSIAHGMNPFKAEAFAAIPDVISQGVVIHEGVNPENGTRYVYISAPVEIEGKDDVVTLLARNTGNGSQMYLHSVATKESILNASDTETAEISRETGKVNSGYIASVLKKFLEYKTETGKGVSVGKKQQKRQAESEAGSVPSEAQPKSGKDYFGLSLYESGQDYKGISEAHYRKFVAELSKLDGWRVNNRKYGRLEFRVDGEEVVFLRRLESLYSEHAVIGFSVYNSRLVEKKFDEIEFVFNPSEPPKETAERLNRFIRSIYPVSEASVQVESNPESEADTHRTPESVRAFSVTLPKLQQKRAVEHLTADALLDGGAKYPQLNGRTTKAGQVEKTLSAGFVPYEEIREQTARMGKERDKMFFKLHREAYGEDSSFDYDNSDDAELKAQTDEALREKHPPKTVYLMKHKQSGDALPITKTQFDYAVYLENMPSEGLRFSRAAKKTDGGHSGSFGETARRYGGEAAYRQAEKDGKTVLSYRRWVQVRTPEFKAWFGDWENDSDNASKVVNPKTGEPLVVYHYTEEQFDTFNLNKARQSSDIPAFFFTTDPEMGMEYGSNEMQVFLNIRNPANKPVIASGKDGKALREELVQNGFDGTVVDDSYDGHLSIEYAALRPNQIKSATGNTGAFDSGNDDIRFSLDESPDSAFARAVDDVTGGKVPAGFISLGTTPDVWKLVGLPDGKVRISGGAIDKAMNGKHAVTAEALKDLPRHLNSPIAVFKSSASSSNPDGYVVLTELVEREKGKDKPIIAALNLGRAKNGLELLDISSVYGRNNGQLTRAFNQDLLYLDKAKGRHFLTTRPLQLHWDITSDADLVGRNIKTDSDLAQYSSAKKQVPVDKAQRMARQHAESIKKRLAESIGGLAERVDVATVSETAPDKAQMLLSERVEGWFDGRTGKITLVAENLTPERAVWVAWHELGHRGFAAEGFAKYREELERADGNSLIRRIADAVQEEREGTGDAAASVRSVAVEEAVVELYAAQRTGDWSGIENRYGVKVGNGLKRGIAGVLARIGALLRRVLQRLTGKADGAMSDADVFAMLADLHGNAEGARDAVSDGVLFSIYSDDADKVARAADILTGSPVADIESGLIKRDENGKVIANAREFIRKWLAENRPDGIFRHPEVGEVMLTVRGVKNSLSHFSADIHVDALPAVPYVLENSAVLEYSKDKNGDNVENVILAAPANIGGKRHYVVVRLRKDLKSGQKPQFYVVAAQLETDAQRETALAVETRSSHDGHIAGGKNRLLNILHSALISVNQIKSAAGNTGTVDAGIADFDTEAVRFSRAANIGAAISHITGKKSDLRNALKDRWDASKGIQLQFLGRRQIEDIYGGSLDGLKEYGRLSELFGADANKAVTEADKVVREWGRLKKEDAKALADLMHDATLAKVDADPLMRGDAQKRLDGIRTALDIADGKIEKAKAVIASADARIARADAAYDKASEAAKKAESALLTAEEKAGREILADEADMRLRRLFYADSEAKRALRHAEADVMAESRAKTDAVQMLKQARADVRRLEKDEVEAQKALEGLALLNRRFAKLPDAAQKVYRKARDDYRAHFGQVRDALAERLARAGQDAETVRRLKERFDNELGGVYFPLARFGDYLVVVKDADGNNVNVSRAETLSEAEKLRDALKADFGAGFKVSPVMKSRDYIQSRDAVSGGFMKELGEAVGMMDLDSAQQAELNDTLTQLYLNSLPDTSWAKHGIHRKGVPGFSDDARRAYAQNMGSGANYLAKLRYADRMAEQLDVMQDFVDGRKYEEGFNQRQLQRVADEMRKRHEAVMNPNPSKLAQALTGFGFLWMMGMSPASAIVNLSQTAMVAYPVMAAKWGYADAARELLRASKQIGLKVGEKFNTIEDSLNEDEKAAFQKAVDYGVIDLSQAHDLAGVANGDPGLAGSAWQKVMDKASWLFHHAEKFNRQVTFVAAYRLAKRAGADSEAAFEQAKKATYDGHFDYAAQNRPRFMMGNVAKVVFLFKQYSQNILYALGRNAYLAFKGDKEARKTLAGLLVSHAMASGILGLPFVSALLALASMLGSDDDDPWDAEAALRNMLADTFGDKAGEVLAKGFSRLTPLDVSGRLGLNQLVFPDIQDGLEGKKWAESLVVGSTGAVVGAGIGAADGVQKILDGRYMEGLESMLPVAIRNPLKAVRYATDGQVDKSGITVKDDFNLFELAGQAAGFRPSDLALKQEGKSAVYRRDRALSAARAKILSAMAKAVVEQDAAALRELRGVVAQWNRKHPERAIKSENIMAGVRNRQRRVAGAKDGIYLSDRHSDARTDGGFAFGH
nr:PLxRFG domain-containing protein [Neisseria polysaccharea]